MTDEESRQLYLKTGIFPREVLEAAQSALFSEEAIDFAENDIRALLDAAFEYGHKQGFDCASKVALKSLEDQKP